MRTELPTKSTEHEAIILRMRDGMVEKFGNKIAMVILFGSFARGDWVFDVTKDPGGAMLEYASDYDFLVLTKSGKYGTPNHSANLEFELEALLEKINRRHASHDAHVIVESMKSQRQINRRHVTRRASRVGYLERFHCLPSP